MHKKWPDTVQDDLVTLVHKGDTYTARKGNVLDLQHFLDCYSEIPWYPNMTNACYNLVHWNIRTPIENQITAGTREHWSVFAKNGTLFGSIIYLVEQVTSYTGEQHCFDTRSGIIPSMRGQGLSKYIDFFGEYVGRNGGNVAVAPPQYSIVDSATGALKREINNNSNYIGEEDRFSEKSFRFERNYEGRDAYWAAQGMSEDLFTWTRGTSPITDAKWKTPMIEEHLKDSVAWNDPSRFS